MHPTARPGHGQARNARARRLAAAVVTLALVTGLQEAAAQVRKPAPSSPTAAAMAPSGPPVDDRKGKLGLNFGAGPLLLVNLNPLRREATESAIGVSGRFGYELRFGLVPEVNIDFGQYLLKGSSGADSASVLVMTGGARYVARLGRWNPFGAAGGGYVLNRTGEQGLRARDGERVLRSGGAFSLGGGVDVRVHTHVYVEAIARYLGYFDDSLTSALLANVSLTLYY